MVHLRAVQSRAKSRTLTVHVAPPPAPPPPSSCGSSQPPTTPVGMTAPGCGALFSDTSANPNPVPIWGPLQCVAASRYSYVQGDADPHLEVSVGRNPTTPTASSQSTTAMTCGASVASWG